ncbi:glutamine amidotransferase [Segnochrobactrum spirostomi]|uniref:Glutamine amidotransferase n=1 Tax=Segnochrobactrum spirostomi TaxID=2608987 RepID=A0A6A7XZ15_9HYPH|nr:glutamine amidotransferase [Segnochrobactrum spirostomi]MQT11357.1 glutamine amidotransferase [Segnochrobactrum spirostomi]
MKPLVVLQCEVVERTVPEWYSSCGEMSHAIAEGIGLQDRETLMVPVCDGVAPPPPEEVSAIALTGAAVMVGDGLPWIHETSDYVRRAIAAGVPVLGVCFGHQLLAHALGGTVGPIDGAPEYGTATIGVTEHGRDDPLFAAAPETFAAQAAHYQGVLTPPADAVVLARNEKGIQALRYAPRAWGLQFHPEFTAEGTALTLALVREPLEAAGLDVDAALAGVSPSPEAAAVLAAFGAVVRSAD